MTDQLSPAAQAVRLDLSQVMQGLQPYCRISYAPTDVFPFTIECNHAGIEVAVNNLLAAALRAAVEQVLPEEPLYGGDQRWMYERDARQERRKKLIAIADELENHQ